MYGRIAFFLLLATLGLGIAGFVLDWRVTLPEKLAEAIGWREGMSDEDIVRDDMRWNANDRTVSDHLADAVARDDAADVRLYLDVANDLGVPLAGGLQAAAILIQMREDSAETQFADYVSGFATGNGDTAAGLAGAISSDLTVYGDVRDIVVEGGKMIAGEPYSEFILGLSAVGLAATVGTYATGGGGVVAKAGISLVKFAKRAGHMTAAFAARLTRLASDAADIPALKKTLRSLDIADPAGSWKRLTAYAANVKGARVFDVLGKLEDIRATVGTTEALRLLKRIEKIEDVDDIHGLTKAAGKRTRGAMELTGKSSFRAIKYTANIVQIAFEYVWGLVVWIAGLLAMIALKAAMTAWRMARFAARRLNARPRSPSLSVR